MIMGHPGKTWDVEHKGIKRRVQTWETPCDAMANEPTAKTLVELVWYL